MGLQTENLILSSKLVKLLESHEREYVKFSSGYIEKFIVEEYLFKLIQLHRQEVIALRRAARSDAEFKNLLAYVIWPREITRGSHTFEVASKLSRQREVLPARNIALGLNLAMVR